MTRRAVIWSSIGLGVVLIFLLACYFYIALGYADSKPRLNDGLDPDNSIIRGPIPHRATGR